MERIRIKNLRSLIDTGPISIKPLTLLLGQNSSGKSTFLRSFPLIRQSIETRTTGPILWYGRFVDFGIFKDAINKNNKENETIEFIYDINISKLNGSYFGNRHVLKYIPNTSITVNLQVSSDKEGRTYASKVSISYSTFNFSIEIDKDGNVTKFILNGSDILKQLTFQMVARIRISLIPNLSMVIKDKEPNSYRMNISESILEENLNRKILNLTKNKKLSSETIFKIVSSHNLMNDEIFLESIKTNKSLKSFKEKVSNWDLNNQEYQDYRNLVLACLFPFLLEICEEYFYQSSKYIYYIAPLRAYAERYYRPQDLSVDEVDFQGKNLALFLRSLTDSERRQFEVWSKENFGFLPKIRTEGGHLTIKVNYGGSEEYNIADMGFGFSQVLPIITQIWAGTRKNNHQRIVHRFFFKAISRIFAIEQPELHLHPKFQSKLIDAIINVITHVDENDMKIKFIIETHSETIVNAIGARIYKNKISKEDVNIILFEKDDSLFDSKIREVKFSDDGGLRNWPYGFFEE